MDSAMTKMLWECINSFFFFSFPGWYHTFSFFTLFLLYFLQVPVKYDSIIMA